MHSFVHKRAGVDEVPQSSRHPETSGAKKKERRPRAFLKATVLKATA